MAAQKTNLPALVGAAKVLKAGQPVTTSDTKGINNTLSNGASPTYNITEAENVIASKEGSIIILGRDRPGSPTSGTGAGPNTNVSCIDIIAGLSGPIKRETDSKGARVVTNKSTEIDSARIYITERAKDIDSKEYFSLAKGNVGYLTNRSAIAIKADSVRIIGREGIKLVTSTDTRNGASGLFIGDNIQGVDIIAGNDDSDLQPMVKGDNLVKVLDSLLELIQDVHSSVAFQTELILASVGSLTDPTGASAAKLTSLLSRMPAEIMNLSCQERNFSFHKMNYSDKNPFAKFDFRSKYNHVN
tara:strand:- start:3502 stop:4404 length:903 start_codon:yes stop_codon:yes gene_type:complete